MLQAKPSTTPDAFGDDLMIKAQASPAAADKAALILAWCRGLRHVLTPLAWVGCAAFAYLAAERFL